MAACSLPSVRGSPSPGLGAPLSLSSPSLRAERGGILSPFLPGSRGPHGGGEVGSASRSFRGGVEDRKGLLRRGRGRAGPPPPTRGSKRVLMSAVDGGGVARVGLRPRVPVSFFGEGVSQVVAAFLRSQCSSCGPLEVRVGGESGNLVQGFVPHADIVAEDACFKGISITHISLSASKIQLQLPEIKGPGFLTQGTSKPGSKSILKHKFTVAAKAFISQKHLNASLKSPLFQEALINILPTLSGPRGRKDDWSKISIATGSGGVLTFSGVPKDASQQTWSQSRDMFDKLQYRASLLPTGRHLRLQQFSPAQETHGKKGSVFDLGRDANIEAIEITDDGILVRGTFTVYP